MGTWREDHRDVGTSVHAKFRLSALEEHVIHQCWTTEVKGAGHARINA